MYVHLCSAVQYIWMVQRHTAAQSEETSSDPAAASSSSSSAVTPQPHPSKTLPYPLSVTPHAFDEFVRSNKSVPCVHRAVCTVPRRGCEHMQKAPAVICQLALPTEPASGLRHCSVWLWLAHSAGQASGAQPSICCWPPSARFAAQNTLHYCCCWLAPETGRGRIACNERARLTSVSKASRALARGAVAKPLLLSLPSRPSGTYHAAPKLAHAMVRGRSWSNERGLTVVCGCVSEVCLPSLE